MEDEVVEKYRLLNVASDQDAMLLREVSEPITLMLGDNSGKAYPDSETKELVHAMKEYVEENDGLGIAAIQLGIKKRVIVLRRPFNSDRIITMINPQLIRGSGKSVGTENCFSIDLPKTVKGARVQRMTEIFVSYTDEYGVFHDNEMLVGMDARVFLHELDHLNGSLFLDEVTSTKGKFKGWARAF